MGFDAMLLATLSALLIFLIALRRHFVTDLIGLLWSAYVTQRLIVVYLWPDEIDYQGTVSFNDEVMVRAVLFIFLSALALTLGALIALSNNGRRRTLRLNRSSERGQYLIPPMNLFGRRIAFERLAILCSWIVVIGFIFRIYAMFVEHVGFTGQSYSRESAVLVRLSLMSSSLGFIIFVATVAFWNRLRHRKLILLAFVITLFGYLLAASKAALLVAAVSIVIAIYLIRGSIPKKAVFYASLAFLVTGLAFAAVATQIRASLLVLQAGSSVPVLAFSGFSPVDTMFALSARLGASDWLAGLMYIGREQFYQSANLSLDLIHSVNALVPGDIVALPNDYVDIGRRIPQLLRGHSVSEELGGHGELLGGLGMAYVYFGELAGPAFFGLWVWGSIAAIRSSLHLIIRFFVIQFFLLDTFTGNGFATMLFHAVNLLYLSVGIYGLDQVSSLFRKRTVRLLQLPATRRMPEHD